MSVARLGPHRANHPNRGRMGETSRPPSRFRNPLPTPRLRSSAPAALTLKPRADLMGSLETLLDTSLDSGEEKNTSYTRLQGLIHQLFSSHNYMENNLRRHFGKWQTLTEIGGAVFWEKINEGLIAEKADDLTRFIQIGTTLDDSQMFQNLHDSSIFPQIFGFSTTSPAMAAVLKELIRTFGVTFFGTGNGGPQRNINEVLRDAYHLKDDIKRTINPTSPIVHESQLENYLRRGQEIAAELRLWIACIQGSL